jgi:CBS domain containing-hemolysin-like protein
MELDVFNALLAADLRDPRAETVGGYVINRLGRIPGPGEWVEAGGLRLTVDQAAPNRVLRLRVRPARPRRLGVRQAGRGSG